MEILKQGNISKIKQTKKFECTWCGCVFLADNDEYDECIYGIRQYKYRCICPTCDTPVYSD